MKFNDYLDTDEGASLYDGIKIDDATKENLREWFGYRDIIEPYFKPFYRRELKIARDRYYSILRVETVKADWTITEYLEEMSETETSGSGTNKGTKTSTKNGTATDTSTGTTTASGTATSTTTGKDTKTGTSTTTDSKNGTKEDTTTINEKTTGTRESNGTSTQTSDSTTNDSKKTVNGVKNAPQSIAYSGADDGSLPALDWQYMTGQSQTEETSDSATNSETSTTDSNSETTGGTKTGTTSTTGKTTDGGTSKTDTSDTTDTSTTGTTTNESTTKTTSENSRNTTDTGEETDTSESTSSGNDLRKSIRTGHNGELAEIFDRALSHIKGTSALAWLLGRLDSCFLMVYDMEEWYNEEV